MFTQQMNQVGIVLPYAFFDLLRENALALENTGSSPNTPSQAPSETQVVELYKKCYSEIFGNGVFDEVLKTLEDALIQLEQQRLQHYRGIPNTRFTPHL